MQKKIPVQVQEKNIPTRVLEELDFIAGFDSLEDDWIVIKKHLLRALPVNLRELFSKRCEKTKKPTLNEFEQTLIDIYKDRTGITPRLKNAASK